MISNSSLKPPRAAKKNPVQTARAPLLHAPSSSAPEAVQEGQEVDDSWLLEHLDSVVQWETASFFAFNDPISDSNPEDGDEDADYHDGFVTMVMGVTRIGPNDGTCRVKWGTFDRSAEAGKNYVPVKDQWVEFGPGESTRRWS